MKSTFERSINLYISKLVWMNRYDFYSNCEFCCFGCLALHQCAPLCTTCTSVPQCAPLHNAILLQIRVFLLFGSSDIISTYEFCWTPVEHTLEQGSDINGCSTRHFSTVLFYTVWCSSFPAVTSLGSNWTDGGYNSPPHYWPLFDDPARDTATGRELALGWCCANGNDDSSGGFLMLLPMIFYLR